jgi:uncharacterized iron-regulated membrane protein
MTLHRFLLVTHRWIGIVTAVIVFALSASGAVIVYSRQIDRLTHPSQLRAEPTDSRVSVDSMVAAVEAHVKGQPVRAVRFPEEEDGTVELTVQRATYYVDPFRGRVVGERHGGTILGAIRRMHTTLLMGSAGNLLAVITTLLAAYIVLGGMILWWPRRIWTVKRTGTWRGLNFDLHNVTGIYSSVVLLVFCVTAVWMRAGGIMDPRMARMLDSRARPPMPQVEPPSDSAPRASVDALIRAAEGALPGRIVEVALPVQRRNPIVVRKIPTGDVTGVARSRVLLDPYDARVLLVDDWTAAQPSDRIIAAREDLHTSDIWGTPSRIVGFIACVLMAFQAVSGPLIWWKPRKKRETIQA